MSDLAIKRRLDRAKRKAQIDLEYRNYFVIPSNNRPVCLVAIQGSDVRLIRICLDKAEPDDKKALSEYPGIQRELWVRKEGQERFEIHRI